MDAEREFVVPPAEKWRRTSVVLPERVWELLENARREENATRDDPEKLSRDKLLALYVEWADHERRRRRAKR